MHKKKAWADIVHFPRPRQAPYNYVMLVKIYACKNPCFVFRIHIILLSQGVGKVLSLNPCPKTLKALYQNGVFVLTP